MSKSKKNEVKVQYKAVAEKYQPKELVNSTRVTLAAKIAEPIPGAGAKTALTSRSMLKVDTGVTVECSGCRVQVQLLPSLTAQGLLLVDGSLNAASGPLVFHVVNCGRGIIDLKDGDIVATAWAVADPVVAWEASE